MATAAPDLDPAPRRPAVTLPTLARMHRDGHRIAALTAYDATFAALLDRCGVDLLLVGDSLGNVVQGHADTLSVTVEDMAYHTACVARGNAGALVMADLPFGAFGSLSQAHDHAVQLMKAGAQVVKIEGGAWLADTVRHLAERGVPVCVHLGLTPQYVHQLGGFKVQGRTPEAAERLRQDALALQAAGAAMVLLEAIPAELGRAMTEELRIPTIGIGAGPGCSGQILVLHDMLGISPGKPPRFVRNFLQGRPDITAAIRDYVQAVREGTFPGPEHGYLAAAPA